MDNYILKILVNDGEVFDGDLNQWEDCFFAFPVDFTLDDKLAQIQRFCASESWDLTLSFKLISNQKSLLS
jgi:hypothetical protein